MKIEQVAENLENGNIKDAKEGAKGHTSFRISMYLRQIKSWSLKRSWAAAHFLKGENGVTFQQYCDTK